MSLPNVGIRLVAEDATKFDSAVRTAGSVLDGFGKTASAVTSSVNSAFSGMASAVGNALAPIGRIFNQIFVSVIRSVVNDAIHQIERFGKAVIDAALEGTHLQDSIERLGTSLNSVANSAFKPFTDKLGEMVDNAAPAFLGIVQAAESYLGGLGTNALTWGQNLITEFANGMWAGVGNILTVLTDIANMITYWLSPGSPPRLLPDIDKWGTSAANEFFGGWMKADFGIFNELGSTLTNLIRSIPIGKGDQSGVIPSILGARQGIAAAVEQLRTTGTITKETMDAITQAVGTSDESVRGYLESMIRLQAANANTKAAQEELNKVTKVYEDLLKPIDAEIADISEEQQQLADEQKKSLLELVLKDPNATLAEKRQAQLEIERLDAEKRRRAMLAEQAVAVDAAKDKVEAAKTAQELAQEDFDSRKALIQAQTEQNNLLKEQLRLLEAINATHGGGGGVKPPAGGKVGGPSPFDIKPFDLGDFIPDDILAKWEAFVTAFESMWGRITKAMQPAIDAWNKDVIPAWNKLVNVFATTIPDIESAIGELVAFAVIEMGISLPVVFDNLGKSLGSLAQIWDQHHKTILAVTVFTFKAIFATISGIMIIISGIVAVTLAIISGSFSFWSKVIQGDWTGAWGVIKQTVIDVMAIVGTTIKGVLDAAFAIFDLTTKDITRVWSGAFKAIQIVVGVVLPQVEQALKTVFNNIKDNIIQPVIDKITAFGQALIKIWEWIQEHVFKIDLPNIPGINAPSGPSGMSGMVNGPSNAATMGSTVITNGGASSSMTYAPTYISSAPPPSAGFATMQALFG